LGDSGADVVVNYVAGEDKAEQVCGEIREFGVRASPSRRTCPTKIR